jgi:hypothetical protein
MKIIVSGTRGSEVSEGLVVDLYKEVSLPTGRNIKVFRSVNGFDSGRVATSPTNSVKEQGSKMGLF